MSNENQNSDVEVLDVEAAKAAYRASISDEEVARILGNEDEGGIGYEIGFIQQCEPIYNAVFGILNRTSTDAIPTMGVVIKRGQAELFYSPKFCKTLTRAEVRDVLRHEALHLIFEHCSDRNFLGTGLPHNIVNIAMDLAINSHLSRLPIGCWKPGQRQKVMERDAFNQIVRDELGNPIWVDSEFADFTQGLPANKATEYYIRRLLEYLKHNPEKKTALDKMSGGKGGSGGVGENDECAGEGDDEGGGGGEGSGPPKMKGPHGDNVGSHAGWEDGEEDGGFGERLRDALRKAAQKCNSTNWGSTSAALKEQIEAMLDVTIPWQQIVKKFINASVPADKSNSIKRINRRYPWIHAGKRREYRPKFNVYIDQSGSVGNEMLARFFGELAGLARKQDFMVYYFDTQVDDAGGAKWRKNSPCPLERRLGGGTCFEAPTKHALESDCDGYFILTDGYAPAPQQSRKRRCWIIGEGCPIPPFLEGMKDIVVSLDEKSANKKVG
jgi:predicted metal-dependent peptidase